MKQSFTKLSAALLFLALAFAVVAPVTFGQTETGTINGTVTDQSGAAVAKARVVVKNMATAAERVVDTDTNGYYSVSNLLPSTYAVSAEAANLGKREARAEVTVGSRVELNFQLKIGAAVTTVEVTSEGGVQVNTETQTIGTVIDSQKVLQLPTLTRNPYDFAANVGTASDGDPSGRGVGVAFNGLRSAGTNILLDGAANNDEFGATVGQQVPLDSVQEFSVLTNNFTAEYGRAAAGVVNVTTKSGGNDFHGSAYEFNRVAKLASESFNNKAFGNPKPEFTRNQFGYSIGGPVKKNKLFFFNNVEWIRIRSGNSNITYVPDAALVAAAGSAVQTYFSQFGTVRSNARQIGVATIGDLETAGVCTSGPCAALAPTTAAFDLISYQTPADAGAGSPQNTYEVVGNVDYTYSDKTTFYARYALFNEDLFAGGISQSPYAGFDTGEKDKDNRAVVSMVHAFNSRLTSQSKLVFNRLNTFDPLGSKPAITGLFFSPNAAANLPLSGIAGLGTHSVGLPGYLPFSPGNGIPFGGPQNFVQAYEDLSWTKGRHTLRFGGSYDYQRDNRTFGAYETPVGSFAVSGTKVKNSSLNNFLNGQFAEFQGAIFPQGHFPCPFPITAGQPCTDPSTGDVYALGNVTLPVGPPVFARSNRYQEFAVYGQDAWKVSNRFTLNLGVRWEYFGVQHNKNPQLDSNYYLGSAGSVFDQIRAGNVALAPQSPVGGLWAPDWNNFAPRLGFAWDIFGDGKTSLRGGYGVGYERNFGNVTFNVIQNPPNYSVVSVITGIDIASDPVTSDPAGPLSGSGSVKAIPKVSLRAVNPHIRTSYAHLYSLSLERQIRHNFVVGVDYSGSKGEKLYDIANINRPGSGVVYEGDDINIVGFSRLRSAQYSNINYRSDTGSSLYNAMVARASLKNFANTGLTLDTSFTWSHTWDELSDTFSSSGNNFNLGYLDPFNPRVDYGNSYLDIRKRYVLQAIWEVPFAKHTHGIAKQALDGWELTPIFTAETGTPNSIYDCTNALQVCPYAFNAAGTSGLPRSGRAVAIPGATNTFDYGGFFTSSGTPLYDSSYANPLVGISDFGPFPSNIVGRNSFRGPGIWNLNIGAYKNFQLTERYKLQFRAEFYNAFNHANLFLNNGNVDVSGADPVANPSISAFKDGLRNIQLALRLDF
ncbi:MAG TPA: TonB-dependent receptor [Candidatus Acidoferrum sp.]|nr:TonB-dependent receptor [Candidatus Acidoferrum sp.]